MHISKIEYTDAEQTFARYIYENGVVEFGPFPPRNGPTLEAFEAFEKGGKRPPAFSPPPPPAPTAADVHAEADRRIDARMPIRRQLQMIARQAQLHRIQTGKMPGQANPRNLTAAEAAEEAEILRAWEWARQVRIKADELAASSPPDYRDDKHWPTP